MPPLVRMLRGQNKEVRALVADALRQIGPLAVAPMIDALKDQNPDVRAQASETLKAMGAAAVPALLQLINESGDPQPRGPHA